MLASLVYRGNVWAKKMLKMMKNSIKKLKTFVGWALISSSSVMSAKTALLRINENE